MPSLVRVISTLLSPSCIAPGTVNEQRAAPGVRFHHFADGFPGRNVTAEICRGDYREELASIGQILSLSNAIACLDGAIHDADAEVSGVQSECVAEVVSESGARAALPVCDDTDIPPLSTNLPCFAVGSDPDTCATPSSLAVVVLPGTEPFGDDDRFELRCLVD